MAQRQHGRFDQKKKTPFCAPPTDRTEGSVPVQNGGFVRYRLEILATLRGELRTGYYLHRRLIAIVVGRHREDDCGRVSLASWGGAPESGTAPLVFSPRSSTRALSNPGRIAFPVLRLRQDPDLHAAPGCMVVDYCCGQERGPGLAPWGAAGAQRRRTARDVLTLLACIYPRTPAGRWRLTLRGSARGLR